MSSNAAGTAGSSPGREHKRMTSVMDVKQTYLQAIGAIDRLPGQSSWVKELRTQARERFDAMGFPTSRHEAWKYTSLAPLLRQKFQSMATPAPLSVEQLAAFLPVGLDAYRLVFLNGRYRPDLSDPPRVRAAEIGGSLGAALDHRPGELEAHLGRIAPIDTHPLAALNTAFLIDGAYVRLPAGATLERPIHVLYVGTEDAFAQPHTYIHAEAGSRAVLIEQYVGNADARYFTNAVTEVVLERGAAIEHYRLQQESAQGFHIGGLYLRQHEDSRFTSYAVDMGGLLVRNDVQAVLAAEGAHCALNGLYVADGRQHVDNHTLIDHAKPHGVSREFYKGVLSGRARAVFNGRVVVQPDAQHTDAEQVNNNLLLSDDAEIDTKPELEIYADDVKCSHGATVGQLDLDQLFYMRARGIDDATARDLLTFAFANDVLHRFRIAPVKTWLERALTARLLQGRGLRELELI